MFLMIEVSRTDWLSIKLSSAGSPGAAPGLQRSGSIETFLHLNLMSSFNVKENNIRLHMSFL